MKTDLDSTIPLPKGAIPQVAADMSVASAAFRLLHGVSWLAVIAQVFIDQSYDNLIACTFVLASASLTFLYIRKTHALRELPLSTMALLGLCVTTQWGALVGQSLLGGSLTANLRVPLATFGYLLGFQCAATVAHWVSRRMRMFMAAREFGASHLLRPLGIFQVPAVSAVWAIGCLGLLSILAAHASSRNLLGKIAEGFSLLAWAPFALPLLANRYGPAYCRLSRHLPFLFCFAGLAVLLGLGFNFRAVMLVGAMTGVLLYLLTVLDDERPIRARHGRNLGLLCLAVALSYQPLSYFLTAVQVAREQRDKISQIEMIKHTFEVLQDPAAIRRETDRMVVDANLGAYDEYYFKSSMIGRLVETKFHDNAFFMVQGVSPQESRLIAQDAADRVLSILPYPVLKLMGMERAKFVTLYSVGDLLANLRLGVEIGQFRTGSMFGQAIGIFGVWTPFLYFLVCIPVFIVWDVLAFRSRAGGQAVISVIGMLLIYRVFANGIVSESLGSIAGMLLRFQVQNVLLYALVFAATRAIWAPFKADAADAAQGFSPGPEPARPLRDQLPA